jgi:hypothetical protein
MLERLLHVCVYISNVRNGSRYFQKQHQDADCCDGLRQMNIADRANTVAWHSNDAPRHRPRALSAAREFSGWK